MPIDRGGRDCRVRIDGGDGTRAADRHVVRADRGGRSRAGSARCGGGSAVSRFDGREEDLRLDGEVTSVMLGADLASERATAGLLLSHSRGEGGYRSDAGDGEVSSTLTGLYPYGRWRVNEGLSVWGVLGYGAGGLTLTPEDRAPIDADLDLAMAGAGMRNEGRDAGAGRGARARGDVGRIRGAHEHRGGAGRAGPRGGAGIEAQAGSGGLVSAAPRRGAAGAAAGARGAP